ncbi:hypothetical protein D3C87_301350 [compost metagenome]
MTKHFVRTFVFLFCLSAASVSGAATASLSETLEIVNLPSSNRRMVVEGKQGEKHYNAFIEVAFSEKQPMTVRWKALMAAAESRRGKATTDLMRAGDHSEWFMRNAALVALAEVNPEKAHALATKLIKDKALVVRSAAVETLRKNETPEVRDLLWEELSQSYNFKKKESLWIRPQIVEVLAAKPQGHEIKIFASLLSDKDQRVQVPAIRGLEKITGTRLGKGTIKQGELVSLWKDHLKKIN